MFVVQCSRVRACVCEYTRCLSSHSHVVGTRLPVGSKTKREREPNVNTSRHNQVQDKLSSIAGYRSVHPQVWGIGHRSKRCLVKKRIEIIYWELTSVPKKSKSPLHKSLHYRVKAWLNFRFIDCTSWNDCKSQSPQKIVFYHLPWHWFWKQNIRAK